MDYKADELIIMTLDAGGTNFVFSALQGLREIVEPVVLPSNAHDLELSLDTMKVGFREVQKRLEGKGKPDAISFAFPGSVDHQNGVVMDSVNLPAFRGGVALGPMLEKEFGLPAYVNNDGDLFAYGEYIAGFLPKVNNILEKSGSSKRYRNMIGVTLGTGFGAGIVIDGKLLRGDNSAPAEISYMRNRLYPEESCEESISIRGIRRVYARDANISFDEAPDPKDIFAIATGQKPGDRTAAVHAFYELGVVLADALANTVALIDGVIVIGGGISAGYSLFLPTVIEEMNRTFKNSIRRRTQFKIYNFEDEAQRNEFINKYAEEINIPGFDDKTFYNPHKQIAVGLSVLSTSQAISIGAYAFAVDKLIEEKIDDLIPAF